MLLEHIWSMEVASKNVIAKNMHLSIICIALLSFKLLIRNNQFYHHDKQLNYQQSRIGEKLACTSMHIYSNTTCI